MAVSATTDHGVLHVVAESLVTDEKNQIILELPEVPLGAARAEDPLDERRDLQPVAADGFSVVADKDQTRPRVADVVPCVFWSGGKRNQLEGRSGKDRPKTVAQFVARLLTIDLIFLPPHHECQVRFSEEP
jgi:hypothetical protein